MKLSDRYRRLSPLPTHKFYFRFVTMKCSYVQILKLIVKKFASMLSAHLITRKYRLQIGYSNAHTWLIIAMFSDGDVNGDISGDDQSITSERQGEHNDENSMDSDRGGALNLVSRFYTSQ
jgi:hypothetical protein